MRTLLARVAAVAALAVAGFVPVLAAGTPAGTVITNQASVAYSDVNGNPLTSLSNVVSTTVAQVASVTVDPDNGSTADPGDVVYYAHLVTNGGNAADTIDLTAVSSQGWTVALYQDVGGNGLYDAGVDILLTDTDADGTPDTGALAADGTYAILVSVTVPTGAANGTVDTTTVTGTSTFNTAVFDTATDTTTIAAPSLSVTKSVAPVGPQPPGAVLTYTMVVTNNGAAAASGVVLTDPIPTFTTYVASSITRDAAPRTDAPLDDDSDFGSTTPGAVTVDIGALAPGASTTITFQVTID